MRLKTILVLLVLSASLGLFSTTYAAQNATKALPIISGVRVITPTIVTFEKFEIQFDVQTTASNLYMPFDGSPPPGVPRAIGVTVDGLFSNDGWKSTIIQPAFWYQPYDYAFLNNQDHFVPNGSPRWAVRFAPQTPGAWQFRLRVIDANGISLSPPQPFTVMSGNGERYDGLRTSPYSQNGFLRVSQTDPRYFEFQNGAPFHAEGYDDAFYVLPAVQSKLRAWQENEINFTRIWLSGSSINGAAWSSWSAPGLDSNSEPFTSVNTAPGTQFNFYLNNNRRCIYTDFNQEDVPVVPHTTYTVSVQLKTKDIVQWDRTTGGLAVRAGGFSSNCLDVKGINADTPMVRGTLDWTMITGNFTTRQDQYWLPYLWFILDKAQGEIWIDQVSLYRSDDPAKVNLLREPRADSNFAFDPMNSFKWDQFVQIAEQTGTFLKLVTDEKGEWLRNHIAPDGSITDKGSNNNFYAAPNTEVRWLDQAWWRYLIARWGYSTAIHSFEFINEGDPFLPRDYNAADAMAKYFHQYDPSHHMVTTSFWHSYPAAQFWANPDYSNMDYADLHAYILTGWGDNSTFVPAENLETRQQYVRSNPTSLHLPLAQDFEQELTPRGLALREPGTWTIRYWIKGVNAKSSCSNATDARVWWVFDDGLETGKPQDNKTAETTDNECGAPEGTFDWTEIQEPIQIDKSAPREFHLFVSNNQGLSGDIWIDDLLLVSPSGKVAPVLGSFNPDSFTRDTAWYSAAYSELLGANSPVAARMPLIRGEAGINSLTSPNGLMEMNQDQDGVWLHNLIWGQINAGGMYDLYWWGSQMIENNDKTGRKGDLFWQYRTFQEFMWDIPINNGNYHDAKAQSSDPNLRVWGQRDDVNGRIHLWIQNTSHTWDRIVNQQSISAVSGIITLRDLKPGKYQIEWWDTYATSAPVLKSETMTVTDTMKLELPHPLSTDIAVKIQYVKE